MPSRIRRRRKGVAWTWLVALLALGATACGEQAGGAGASDTPSAVAATAPSYADELARLDGELAHHRARAGATIDAWPAHEQVARALLERAALTGRFEDYGEAVAAIAAAQRLGGPVVACGTAARVMLAVHRPADARAALERCGRPPPARAEDADAVAIAADLARHEGRHDDALRDARAVLRWRETPGDLARLALIHADSGAVTEALALIDRAERVDHAATPALRAWLALQRGLIALHRGRWEEALAHYLAAQRQLAGWWLVDEHIAEVRALLGQLDAAKAVYARLLAAEPRADVMDAYARLLRRGGQAAEAEAWIGRARAAHAQRRALLPEAADGHALLHGLEFAPGAPDTLALARRHAGGPRHGAVRLAAARALLAANRTREAVAVIEALRATPWRSAELHAVAAGAYDRVGLVERSRAEAALAAQLNPRWRAQYASP